jgi:hypothetical protein
MLIFPSQWVNRFKLVMICSEMNRLNLVLLIPNIMPGFKLFDHKHKIDEGAVRIAAMEKTHFEVTHFVNVAEIQKDPKAIERIFPAPLCPIILQKAGASLKSI